MIARVAALRGLSEGLRRDRPTAAPSESEWPAILELANRHLLAPALYGTLESGDRLELLPPAVRDYLALLHRANGLRNQALRRQALELCAALAAAGVEPMLLKGCVSLFAGPYADGAARMIGDIDVLVPAAALTESVAVLIRLGYAVAHRYPAGHNAHAEFVQSGDPGAVDLHVEPIDARHLLSAGELWRRAMPMEIGGVRFHAPAPNDRLLHNILHAQIHDLGGFYRGDLQLRQLHECVVMARAFGPAVDWGAIEGRFADHRVTTPLHSYLLAAHRLFGLAWPLAAAPSLNARLHYRRCVAQLHFPILRAPSMPWGNLRAAFAAHRMLAFYGQRSNRTGLPARLLHVQQFLRKQSVDQAVARLFRDH